MDRNEKFEGIMVTKEVALRKESVDRNRGWTLNINGPMKSLSARRAWIEIIDYIIDYATDASLSARRAWIEMLLEVGGS